jgi:hypothetical protein
VRPIPRAAGIHHDVAAVVIIVIVFVAFAIVGVAVGVRLVADCVVAAEY